MLAIARNNPLLIGMLMACLVGRISGAEPGTDAASIKFHIIDAFGHPVAYSVKGFREVGQHPDANLASRSSGNTIMDIPLGTYDYELLPADAKSFEPLKGQVSLLGTGERWLTLLARTTGQSQLTMEVPPDGNRGLIVGLARGREPLWVRLMWAFDGRTVEEVPVGRGGTFRFGQTHVGKYILTVFQGNQVAYLGILDMNGVMASPVRIDLARSPVERVRPAVGNQSGRGPAPKF